jgi:putative FmdB family regulatory protein
MPTYEYLCEKCDHRFDFFQSITEKALRACPKEKCGMKKWGKGRVKRVIGAGAGLIFKGSGFYITDYRSDSYKEAAKKESGAATGGTSSESKPAAGASEAKPKKAESKTPPAKSSGKD